VTIFCCLRFETSLFVASYNSQGQGWRYSTPPPKSQSEPYVTTDGQSASLSWNKAPIWGLRPDFYYCQRVSNLLMWGALSDERAGLSFTNAAGRRQLTHSRVRVPWDSRPYFTVSDSRFPFSSSPTTRRATGIRSRLHRLLSLSLMFTTGGQSASLSWNKAPIWGLRPDFYYSQSCGFVDVGHSLTRGRVCHLQLLLSVASAVIFGSESRGTRDHILLSQIRDFPFRRLEVFEPASTERERVTLRLTVYRQSVRLGTEPLGNHGQNFPFFIDHLRS
jgi:hypothetical protein